MHHPFCYAHRPCPCGRPPPSQPAWHCQGGSHTSKSPVPSPPEPRPWCLALVGPTASGKSAAALALARELPLEIISVDSALVYRGMDIGTAKPTAAERAAVAHHLIDIRDPREPYSAAQFAADAQALVTQINQRGHLALLVGGTMLYLKALMHGLHPLPPRDEAVRSAIEAQAAAQGWPALHAELARTDPQTAARLAPQDSQRIQRALEVWRLSGRPLSAWHGEHKADHASRLQQLPLLSLEPRQRQWLHERIARRLDAMLAQGLLEEVDALRRRGDLHPDLPSMRCVGYRQAWQALEQHWPIERLREAALGATRQLAKRQLTWLRSLPQRHVLDCDDPAHGRQLLPLARALAGERT